MPHLGQHWLKVGRDGSEFKTWKTWVLEDLSDWNSDISVGEKGDLCYVNVCMTQETG